MKHVRNIFRNTKTSSKNTDEKEKKEKEEILQSFLRYTETQKV